MTGVQTCALSDLKRFFNPFSTLLKSKGKMASVALTKSEHAVFTREWRKLLPYGTYHTKDEIIEAVQIIYKNYPELLEIALKELGIK